MKMNDYMIVIVSFHFVLAGVSQTRLIFPSCEFDVVSSLPKLSVIELKSNEATVRQKWK